MDYHSLHDYELVMLSQDGNEESTNILHEKYKPLIYKKCKKIYPYVSKKGLELSDLVQECLIGFEEAIANFKESDDVTFYTFCNVCMDRQLKSVITKLNRDKYKILNEAISIDLIDDNGEQINFIDALANNDNDPLKDILTNENFEILVKKIKKQLTNFEECVFDLKLQGFDYREISLILDKPIKSVDNALTRIRIKIKKVLKKYNI